MIQPVTQNKADESSTHCIENGGECSKDKSDQAHAHKDNDCLPSPVADRVGRDRNRKNIAENAFHKAAGITVDQQKDTKNRNQHGTISDLKSFIFCIHEPILVRSMD